MKESVEHEEKAYKTKENIENEALPIENGELLLSSECYGLHPRLYEATEKNIRGFRFRVFRDGGQMLSAQTLLIKPNDWPGRTKENRREKRKTKKFFFFF